MPSSTTYRLTVTAVACAVAASLGACGAGPATASNPAPVPVPSKTPAETEPAPDPLVAYYELPEGTVRVTGVVFSADDNMLPRKPFQSGVILAMTRERYEAFRLAARGPWKAALMDGGDFPMPSELLAEPGMYRSNLDAGGTYSLTMPPGEYKLCLANLSEVDRAPSPDNEVWVDKAFDATVTTEDLQTIVPVLNRETGELVLHR